MSIYDNTINVLQRALDLRMDRHAVLSTNVANSETPGYRARELDFSGELERVLGRSSELVKTNARHMDLSGLEGQTKVMVNRTVGSGADGNNVDLDLEVGKISENSRIYDSAANYLTMKLKLIREASRGPQGG